MSVTKKYWNILATRRDKFVEYIINTAIDVMENKNSREWQMIRLRICFTQNETRYKNKSKLNTLSVHSLKFYRDNLHEKQNIEFLNIIDFIFPLLRVCMQTLLRVIYFKLPFTVFCYQYINLLSALPPYVSLFILEWI